MMEDYIGSYKEELLNLVSEIEEKYNSFDRTLHSFEEELATTLKGKIFKTSHNYSDLKAINEKYRTDLEELLELATNFSFEDSDFGEYESAMNGLLALSEELEEEFIALRNRLY